MPLQRAAAGSAMLMRMALAMPRGLMPEWR